MSVCRCGTCGGTGLIQIDTSLFTCPDCDGHGWKAVKI